MATTPMVDLMDFSNETVVTEPVPNEATALLMSAASGTAYHKSARQRIKSFLGTKLRGNAKGLTKQGIRFGLSHIPIAGPYVAAGFDIAALQAEGQYKKQKAQKLRRQREQETDWEDNMKAQIKMMTFQNAMGEIDKARKKVDLSATECRQDWWNIELDTCGTCTEAFYHWYRLEHRARKLKVKVAAVREVLKDLERYANQQLHGSWQARRELIAAVNDFTDNHVNPCSGNPKLTYFKDVCVIDLKGQQNLENADVKGSLIG